MYNQRLKQDELMHYGVLGMRWGHRKDRTGSAKGRKAKNYSSDYKESRAIRKKRPSEMSNAELRKLNERMNLEQNYHRLNPSKVKQGLQFVSAASGIIGTSLSLYNNGNQLVAIGKKFAQKIK